MSNGDKLFNQERRSNETLVHLVIIIILPIPVSLLVYHREYMQLLQEATKTELVGLIFKKQVAE